ncbi:DUF1549 and DUF1553 domain-containing protein [Aeoliella sp. ICT_H6.2]|uniref:DUF1549 and DUF1553 domain-containing protein n=1 Tax=Aeoliella straminimaris TaxID=2954799 RepID=A0A9X2FFU5_9BACT|nr:DUF1549 domain-containing protein [Aeoliella straminimaris]MCO6044946.1 DUF1549 and DUF1553 domain-containing protein [Aeoliella straminimaris]
MKSSSYLHPALLLAVAVSLAPLAGAAGTSNTPSAGDDSDSFGLKQVAEINRLVREGWSATGVSPSKPATDGEWCRRVYLDLVGRVPTVDELRDYVTDRDENKREKLVDRLLGDEYLEEFARNWTTLWTNTLIGRTGGVDRDSLAVRRGMQQYLRRAFQKNKSYDQLATELVTATGSCQPGDSDYNGAANFLADKMSENGIQATAKTAEIFLGMAVGCTQCHNHPFNEYKQNQFWELNAFFRQTRVMREQVAGTNNRRYARVVDRDFAGEGGDPSKAELYYELRNGKLKVAYPVFVDGASLAEKYADRGEDFGDSGYLEDINRRQELADLILNSAEFPVAAVNRMWSHFLGYGFTKPVYDMGPHNPPTHPELLQYLADEFHSSSFDMKELMRWIVLSEPYSLSSRMTRDNQSDDPNLGARPMFSHFYLRQMQAEQLYESLLTATAADESLPYDERERMKTQWLSQFNTAFGTDDNSEATTFNGSIPQALMMMNGGLVKKATECSPGSFLHTVATSDELSNPQRIQYLYEAALARRPKRDEVVICNKLLAARDGNTPEALRDIWWALLNSNEFILIH